LFEIFDSWLRIERTLEFREVIDRIGRKEIKLLAPPSLESFEERAMRVGSEQPYHEAICGPMFSGKTREMHRQYRVFQACGFKIQVFKRDIDKRYSRRGITTHDGITFNENDVFLVRNTEDIEKQLRAETDVVMIDEAQFYESSLVEMVEGLVEKGKIVITTVLPTDYTGKTFRIAGDLLARADYITSLTARCTYVQDGGFCRQPATRTFRKVASDQQVLIGGSESYEPRCRKHHRKEIMERSQAKLDSSH